MSLTLVRSLAETPAEPVPLSELAPWAERARRVLSRFTPLFVADLAAQDEARKESEAHNVFCSAITQ